MNRPHRIRIPLLLCALLATSAPGRAETKIQWDSKDIVESRMTRYKYHRGPAYPKPKDPKAPRPGYNYGSVTLTVTDDPPRLLDRVLKRDAKISGKIAGAPAPAAGGKVWIEDNYGRVIDQADVKGPDFAFRLDASRSLSTGLYLKAELKAADEAVWTGAEEIRMVPPADDDPWADFVLGVYNTGKRPGTTKLFREMGLSHIALQTTNDPSYIVQGDLRFHSSNILYSLPGLYHRDYKRWREIKAAQAKARGPVKLARHRCLSDPKEDEFMRIILTAAALRFKPYQPLHYSIADEIGIGDMASPHDLCGSKWCMARYRDWLKQRYGTIDRLNAQWGSAYKGWGDVEMMSTWQALDRAKTGNFSPWADRLEFMDGILYRAVARGVEIVRAIDPKARCNVSGVQQPSCWQFDHWRLTRTVNCLTPYDIGEGPDVIMSFWNDGKVEKRPNAEERVRTPGKIVGPGFGGGQEGPWRYFSRGYDMAQQWDSFGNVYSRMIDIDRKRLTPFGRKVREFADWVHAGPGRMRNRADRHRDPVAILYSQPSLRGNWILEITGRKDMPDHGDKWVTRGSWSVRQKELSFRVRVSWSMWMHDLGIYPKYVDASQVDDGYLTRNGYKVLVLPRAVALSDATARAIRKFVEAGGTAIADSWCGIMDERCRARPAGALDELFGISRGDYRKIDVTPVPASGKGLTVDGKNLPFHAFERTLKATGGKAGANFRGADVAVTRKVGKGRAIYLNFNLEQYFLQRFFPKVLRPARQYLLDLLAEAGVEPLFPLGVPGSDSPFHPVGHDVCLYRSGRGYLVGVMVNPTVRNSELGGIESRYEHIKDNIFLMEKHPAKLTIPPGLYAYDLVEHRFLGQRRTARFTSARRLGRFYAFWPFEIQDVKASANVTAKRYLRISGRIVTSSPVRDEKLVVALRVFAPNGSEQRAYRRTIDCRKNAFAAELPLALNEHGNWKVVVREPCSGKVAQVTVRLP